MGTPISIPQREFIDIGCIVSLEDNKKPVDIAKKGQKVAIKVSRCSLVFLNHLPEISLFFLKQIASGISFQIVGSNPEEQQKMFGKHFDYEDELVSHISRSLIDILKENYRVSHLIQESLLLLRNDCYCTSDENC